LAFFEKDSIEELVDLEYGKEYRDFYKKLAAFRHNNSVLAAGANVAPIVYVEGAPESVLAFTRSNEENTVFCVFNFSAEPQTFVVSEAVAGEYRCACGKDVSLEAGESLELAPWQFYLLAK
jgi:glycosidase